MEHERLALNTTSQTMYTVPTYQAPIEQNKQKIMNT